MEPIRVFTVIWSGWERLRLFDEGKWTGGKTVTAFAG